MLTSVLLETQVVNERDVAFDVALDDRPPLLYVAAPYSQPDAVHNTHVVIRIADALLDAGFVPLVPHLTLLWRLVSQKPYERRLAYNRQLLARCDAVLRVPGDSRGADQETEYAERLGIPLIHPRSGSPADCVAAVSAWFADN